MMKANGRVDILQPNTNKLFSMFDRNPVNECVSYRDAMQGNWEDTPLSKAFFSKQNIQILQNGIRAGVYDMSNKQYVIGEQSCDNLKTIMRAMFLQHSANLPNNIPKQIEAINNVIINYCVPKVFSEAKGYIRYREDASTLVVPIRAPVQVDTNDKTLELKPWF